MRIAVDARLYGEPSGVGQYIKSVLGELIGLKGPHDLVLFGDHPSLGTYGVPYARVVGHPYSVLGQINMLRLLQRGRYDLVYFPHFTVPIGLSVPFVVTIHDLIMTHARSREASTRSMALFVFKRLAYTATMRFAVSRARSIIASSRSTADDIISTYGVRGDAVSVIYPGFRTLPEFGILPDALQNKEYFLCVGSSYPHKNIPFLIDFMARPSASSRFLALAGKQDAFQKELRSAAHSDRVIFLGYVGEGALAQAYRSCSAFIQPSLNEGFGMPALEALAHGARVVVSDLPIHHEVLGDSVRYFDPRSHDSLEEALGEALSKPREDQAGGETGGKMIANNFAHALPRAYDFKKTAREVWHVITQ